MKRQLLFTVLVVTFSSVGHAVADDCSALYFEARRSSDATRLEPHSECSCSAAEPLARLDTADPIADARAAAKRGDYRLIAIASFNVGAYTPGPVSGKHVSEQGVVLLSGTADAMECYEHLRLNSIAKTYATAYNGEMISLLAQ